jgi:hypothetical protein
MSFSYPAVPNDSVPSANDNGDNTTMANDDLGIQKDEVVSRNNVSSNPQSADRVGFDLLPVVIFNIIQSYLSHYEYRQFLNSNQAIFSSIKFETVIYDLVGFDSWNQPLEFYESTIFNTVKEKSKQIKLWVDESSIEEFEQYKCLFNGLAKLVVDCNSSFLKKLTSLSMFQNINDLELSWISGITHLNDLFGDCLVRLTISEAEKLVDISNLYNFPNLKAVSFFSCGSLTDISPVKDIFSLVISYCPLVTDISMISGKQTCFHFLNNESSLKSIAHLKDVDTLEIAADLSQCDLITSFSPSPSPSSSIKKLCLLNMVEQTKPLSVLKGLREIHLRGIDLSLWNECDPISLKSLESVVLMKCNINNFSCFQYVRILSLINFDHENLDFSDFHFLKRLSITSFHRFVGFSTSLPKSLINLSVDSCRSFTSVFGLTNVPCVSFRRCTNLDSLEGLGKKDTVILDCCLKIKSFSLIKDVPQVTIKSVQNPLDCNDLCNVRELSIESCPSIVNLEMLGDVEDLTLVSCGNISSMQGLGTVRKLTIANCPALVDLHDLGEKNEVVNIYSSNLIQYQLLFEQYHKLKTIIPYLTLFRSKLLRADSL